MNRDYRESDLAAANASDQVTALTNASQWVTPGRIGTNTMPMPIEATSVPGRLWDLISEIAEAGDGTNRWIAGVYAGRKLNYELASTTERFYWRDGKLVDKAGGDLWNRVPSLITPNIVVKNEALPTGGVLPGGTTLDDLRRMWIEEVEYTYPDGYRLVPAESDFEPLMSATLATMPQTMQTSSYTYGEVLPPPRL